jgi:RecB family endonuclease NucS
VTREQGEKFVPIQPVMILDWFLARGAAVSREVPLDRAGRNVADVVAFLADGVYIIEVKPELATKRDLLQIDRYVRAAMRHWPEHQVYGVLVARRFGADVQPRGHLFIQRWPL